MGVSTNAILLYGYNLGGCEGEWKVRETDEYGALVLDWYDWDHEDGFIGQAENRLLAASGFTETDWRADGYFDRRREAENALGVEFGFYCSDNCPMYALATHMTTVSRGNIEQIDPDAMIRGPVEHGWDAKLRNALTVLGLTPTQEQAAWLLCS